MTLLCIVPGMVNNQRPPRMVYDPSSKLLVEWEYLEFPDNDPFRTESWVVATREWEYKHLILYAKLNNLEILSVEQFEKRFSRNRFVGRIQVMFDHIAHQRNVVSGHEVSHLSNDAPDEGSDKDKI